MKFGQSSPTVSIAENGTAASLRVDRPPSPEPERWHGLPAGRHGGESGVVSILAFLATFCLGVALPVLMVIANRSAPATLAAAALFANLAVLVAGRRQELKRRYAMLIASPTALMIGALLVLLFASFAWTVNRGLTTRGLVEGLPELCFALATAAAWPLVARRSDFRWLIAGLLLAAALILFENRTGMPLHALVRARGEAWDLKRSAIPPALLLWPAAAYCLSRRNLWLAAGLLASVVLGIASSHSGAPGLGLLFGVASFFLAWLAPRIAIATFAVFFLALILASPWTGTIASRTFPAEVETALSDEHAAHRIRIWTAFEARAHDRPLLGYGFNASYKVYEVPRPANVVAASDEEVLTDKHPHQAFLQFWVELGLLGGIAAAGVAAFVLSRLAGLGRAAMAPRLGLLATVVGVGLVGLSAWQAWWLASIAASLIWFDLLGRGIGDKAAER